MQNQELGPEIKFQYATHVLSSEAEPWMSQHTRKILNPIVRFHNQIIDFANYVQPTQQQHQLRMQISADFETQIKKVISNVSVYTPLLKNKLYLKSTQLQIFVIFNDSHQNWAQLCFPALEKIAAQLNFKIFNLSAQLTDHQYCIIAQHQNSKTEVWIRFFPHQWKLFISEMDECIATSVEIRYLYLIFFCMLRQRSFHTNVRSLFIYGMCSFFVYERRRQRVRTLTENVIKFLEFFAIGIWQDKQRKIVYQQGNTYTYTMSNDRSFSFEIADKLDISSSRKTRDFFKVLQNRYRVLGNYYYPPGSSVLAHLVNPCLGKFFY